MKINKYFLIFSNISKWFIIIIIMCIIIIIIIVVVSKHSCHKFIWTDFFNEFSYFQIYYYYHYY